MIVFITAQDEPTQDNLEVTAHLAAAAETALCSEEAVRNNLVVALAGAPIEPFLALSHGESAGLRGHDDLPAVTVADVGLLAGRESFALACYTAAELGPSVAHHGGTWFGYAGPVNCLPADADTIHHFRSIVDFIADRFPGCNTPAAAHDFISDLANLADAVADAITASGAYTFELLHALRDITRRLRVWLPGAMDSARHPEAFGDTIV